MDITAQNSLILQGGGNYKCRVESVECKVKGSPDFTALSIPHNQFTANSAACAASSVAAPLAFYALFAHCAADDAALENPVISVKQ